MTTAKILSKYVVALAATVLVFSSCATSPADTQAAGTGGQEVEKTTEPAAEVEPETTSPAPAPEPEPEILETSSVGDLVQMPSADFTVRKIEDRDMVPSSYPSHTPNFEPDEGERLWFLDMEWTNNTKEAVKKECHGPYSFDLRVYDVDSAEMLMVDQPGRIEGQECSTGLRQGETGTWYTAFYGSEAEFGWAVFTDYAGGEAIVTLDPSLELVRNP